MEPPICVCSIGTIKLLGGIEMWNLWNLRTTHGVIVVVTIAGLVAACGTGTPNIVDGQPADADIAMAIETDYLLHELIDDDAIVVTAINGVVTLAGTVDNMLTRTRAVEIASATRGVRSIVNRINVEPPRRSDEAIQSDVFRALLVDPATESYEIEASVQNASVMLTGTVDSWAEKELAYDVAAGVRGVRQIENQIAIEYEERGDHEIEADIERRLETDVMVDAGLINVSVNDGNVELSGTIGSLTEKRRAIHDSYVTGVREVNADDLDVQWWARDEMRRKDPIAVLSDEEIESAVTDALVYDPRVLGATVDVSASRGLVTLDGVVESKREHDAAVEDARNTFGVWDVVDSLELAPAGSMADTELEEMVRNALQRDPYVQELQIAVDVLDNVAYLSGVVDNAFEKNHAEWLIENLKNIAAVESTIDVLGRANADDAAMERQINEKLLWNPWLVNEELEVEVSDAVVSITGSVDSKFELNQLQQIADDVGARALEMDITVDEWPSPPEVGVDIVP
jgi:osmotically-inducible protein OsmY